MKKIIALIMVFLITISYSVIVFASDSAQKTLNFCVAYDVPITVDNYIRSAFQELGYKVTFDIAGNNFGMLNVDSGEKDGFFAQSLDVDAVFSNTVQVPVKITDVNFVPFVTTSSNLAIHSWDDLKGLNVGYLYQKPHIEDELPQGVKSRVQRSLVPQLFNDLDNGIVDVVILSQVDGQQFLVPKFAKQLESIDKISGYIYLNKKFESLIPKLKKVLTDSTVDGTRDKYFNNSTEVIEIEKTILYIGSGDTDSSWDREILSNFKDGIFKDYKINSVFLEASHVESAVTNELNLFGLLRTDFNGKRPALIVVSDNNSFNFIKNSFHLIFCEVPVVFCGISNYSYSSIAGVEFHFTGVSEKISAKETLDTMLKFFPGTRKIFVINDYSSVGLAAKAEIKEQLQNYSLDVEYNENLSLDMLKTKVATLPKDTVILTGNYQFDALSVLIETSELFKAIDHNQRLPIFGLYDATLGYGQIGGKCVEASEQGKLAAQIASTVLSGTPISQIGSILNSDRYNSWVFDEQVMKEWKLTKDQIIKLTGCDKFINQRTNFFKDRPIESALYGIAMLIILSAIFVSTLFLRRIYSRNEELVKLQSTLHSTEDLLDREFEITTIKESSEKIIQTAPIGYALVLGDKVIEVNAYAKDILGINAGDKTSANPIFTSQADDTDPTTKIRINTGDTHRFIISTTTIDYEEKLATIYWYVDTEETERNTDQIKQLELELHKLLDELQMPIVVSDLDERKLLFANSDFIHLMGLRDIDDVRGTVAQKLYPRTQHNNVDSNVFMRDYIKRLRESGETSIRDFIYLSTNGQIIYATCFDIIGFFDGTEAVITIVKDKSDERRREDHLLAVAEKEKEANQLKSRFLVNMSHEIRTPMNAIIGLSELQMLKNPSLAGSTSLKKINESAKILLTIINDILDFSKLEANKLELIQSTFNLEDLIQEIVEDARPKLQGKPVNLSYKIRTSVPPYITSDRSRLSQVLTNILSNSVKFTEVGEIVLKVLADKQSDNEHLLIFKTKDSGCGMTQDQLEKINLPFEQFQNHSMSGFTGTGLGMPITKKLCELMGGSIQIESEVGVGTETTFRLRADTASESDFVAILGDNRIPMSLKGAKILVCEDVEINQEVALGILEHFGAIGLIANNGQEAIDLVKTQEFDVILMDINMPIKDGYQASRELREMGCKTSIIAMTGNTNEEDIALCLNAGMDAHIKKPISLEAFSQTVSLWMPQK